MLIFFIYFKTITQPKLKDVKTKTNRSQFKLIEVPKILEIEPITILVFDGACKDISTDALTRFLTQS